MVLAWIPAVALGAAPLAVEVLPDPPLPARAPARPAAPAPPVPVATADVTADGAVEPAWDAVPEAPPLHPLRDRVGAPSHRARVARAGDRLVVLAPLPDGPSRWLLDRDGTASVWWRVELGGAGEPGADRVERCDAGVWDLPVPFAPPSRVTPCEPTDAVVVARGAEVVEIAFPGDGLTTAARLLWHVEGEGTWSPLGDTLPLPERGRRLDLPMAVGAVGAHADPVAGVWRVEAAPRRALAGPWTWRVVSVGDVLAEGTVAWPEDGPARFDVPRVDLQVAWLELREGDAPWAEARVIRLPTGETELWPTTPAVDDVLVLRWSSPAPLVGLPVRVTVGRRVHETVVDLPEGAGALRMELPRGRGPVVVEAPPLVSSIRLFRLP